MAAERFALVTGGSTGIGAAICSALAAQGLKVIALSREVARAPGVVASIQADLSDPQATREAAREIAARWAVTTVVHNAGAIREKPLEAVEAGDLTALSQLHVGAAITLVQACLPAMRAWHYGRIVLISSRAALGLARRTVYAATKAGMLGLTRTWALELGPEGITVNAVAPGPIAGTTMFHALIPQDSPKMAQIAAGIPVRRLGSPEDVARAVAFLAAPESAFITGQTLYVCGGTSVGSIVY